MKIVFMLVVVLSGLNAFAETELACWNMYSQRGSSPILKAQIAQGQALKVRFNAKDEFFSSWAYDTTQCYEPSCYRSTGVLHQFEEVIQPVLIESNRRATYKGNNAYPLSLGTETYTVLNKKDSSKNESRSREIKAELILPTNLSQEFLKAYRIRSPSERSNAVMIIQPSHNTNQSGLSYLRMFCVSR